MKLDHGRFCCLARLLSQASVTLLLLHVLFGPTCAISKSPSQPLSLDLRDYGVCQGVNIDVFHFCIAKPAVASIDR